MLTTACSSAGAGNQGAPARGTVQTLHSRMCLPHVASFIAAVSQDCQATAVSSAQDNQHTTRHHDDLMP